MSGEEEKYEGLEPENVSNNNSFISSKLSLDDEKILLGRIYKTGLGMIFPCILIMFTSTYAFIESSNKVLLLPAIISVFALFFICLLCYLSRESKLSGTKAPDLLFLCLYFIHFSAAAYFALGILLVFMFGFQTSISYWVSVSILCIEGATTKYLFGYGLIFVFFRKLAIEHHTIQNYLQVMQITLFLCGAGICMTCLAYRSSWLNIDLHYQVPPVILTLGILAGSLLSVLSILLFYAAYAEKLSLLLLCQIFNVVLMIFIFLYGSMVRYSNKLYEEIIKFNCSYILKILNYEMFSCQKYIESDECGKQFIATVWEDGLDPGTRCLNINCCEELEENITLYLEFLMIWAILVFILMVFSFLAGQGLVKKIEKFGKSPERKLDIQLLSVMVIIVLLSLAGWFTFDHGQQKLTRNEPIVSVLNGEILDSTLIPSDLCEKVEVEIKEFSGVSEVKLSSFDGDFSQNFFVGKYKKVQSQIDHSQFYPRFPKEIYVVEVNVTSDDVLKIVNFTSSLYGNFNITGEYLGDGILPFKNIDPATDISYEGSSYLFEVPIVSHAYSIVLSYGEYLMSLVVGGLHSNIAPINIPIFSNFSQVEVSGKISAESYEPTKVFLSTGFNNLTSPIFKTSTTNFGSFTLGINPGLYTAYTNRVNWASAVQNLAVDSSEIDLNFIIFPLSLNRGFITTMTSNNSELHVEFNLSQNSSCKIDLKFPRCGGTKIIYVEHGEIMATAQISASQYLVYAKSENFSNDFAAFYTKNMEFPIVRLQGKEGEKGVWMLYCLNGRQGVSSLKVLDLYVDEEQFNSTRICERFYGEETWTSDEINKGQILVT